MDNTNPSPPFLQPTNLLPHEALIGDTEAVSPPQMIISISPEEPKFSESIYFQTPRPPTPTEELRSEDSPVPGPSGLQPSTSAQPEARTDGPTVVKSQCKQCGKKFNRWSYYVKHVKTKNCQAVGYFCKFCSTKFNTKAEKEKHKNHHALSMARQQIGMGLQNVGRAHSCAVFEETFEPEEVLTIDELFSLRRNELQKIIRQSLHSHKVIKFGTNGKI